MGASVLINTSDATFADSLRSRLRTAGVHVVLSQPGLSFMQVARREQPHVALLDAVEDRVDAAEMEIELLKELRQDVRIIALSRRPSQRDAWVVECGVFFYLAAPAVGEVVRVIEAAARAALATRLAREVQSR